MSKRKNNIDNSGFDIEFGGKLPEGFDLSDVMNDSNMDEIMNRIQIEEQNPNVISVDEFKKSIATPYNKDTAQLLQESRMKDFEIERYKNENRERLDEIDKEKRARYKQEQEYKKELESTRRLSQRPINLLTPYDAVKIYSPYVEPFSPYVYRRLYNLGLDLIPDYYTHLQKKQLENLMDDLIKKELRYKKSEYEIEDRIKTLIQEAQTSIPVEKTPKVTRAPAKKTSKKKSKKTSKKKSKKTSKRKK